MWFEFGKIEEKEFEGRNGKPYTCFEITGIKKGFQNAPDTEWSKKVFRNDAATIIEDGVRRSGIGVVSFFENAVKPGDLVDIKQEQQGGFWKIISLENITGKGGSSGGAQEYTPLNKSEGAVASAPWD